MPSIPFAQRVSFSTHTLIPPASLLSINHLVGPSVVRILRKPLSRTLKQYIPAPAYKIYHLDSRDLSLPQPAKIPSAVSPTIIRDLSAFSYTNQTPIPRPTASIFTQDHVLYSPHLTPHSSHRTLSSPPSVYKDLTTDPEFHQPATYCSSIVYWTDSAQGFAILPLRSSFVTGRGAMGSTLD